MSGDGPSQRVPGAERAYVEDAKLAYLLSADGHGPEFARTLRLSRDDGPSLGAALLAHVRENPAGPPQPTAAGPTARKYEVVGDLGVGARRVAAVSVWEILEEEAAPRLVTAYPRPR